MKRMRFFTSGLILLLVTISCAGKNPVTPDKPGISPGATPAISSSGSSDNRLLWGYWDVYISADRSGVEVIPNREGMMHLNAVRLLETMPCSTCLKIGNIKVVGPNLIEADLTLIHPYPGVLKLTGFDVRGIFISESNFEFPVSGRKIAWGTDLPIVLNADGYTSLFNPTEFPPTSPPALGYIKGKFSTNGDLTATLNPYMAFRKNAPRCMFEPGGSETRTVKLYLPSGPVHFGYAVDVNWVPVGTVIDPLIDFPLTANCPEAYRINVSIGSGLHSDPGSSVPIAIEIYDHQGQDTISIVAIEAPDLFNGALPLSYNGVSPNGAYIYTGTLPNNLGAPDGEYPLLAVTTDFGSDPFFGKIHAWQVSHIKVGPKQGWALTWGGEDHDKGISVAVYGPDTIYVTGHFQGSADFDPGPGIDEHPAIGKTDSYLSKFNSNGVFLGTKIWGGSDFTDAWAVAIDDSENVYVTGCFDGIVDFDPGPGVDEHTCIGSSDSYLMKFNSNGDFAWARSWGGDNGNSSPDAGYGVTVDQLGRVYVIGVFNAPADFDPGPGVDEHTNVGVDVYVSKFDSNGDFVWARTWEAWFPHEGGGIATDGLNAIYITGFFGGTTDFDPGPGIDEHTVVGMYDSFLTSFYLDGNFKWAQTWGSSSDDGGLDVAVGNSDNVWVSGFFGKTADFDPGPGVDEHTAWDKTYDAYITEFNSSGEFILARTWGGPVHDYPYGIAVDNQNNVLVTGDFWETVDFDPGQGIDNHTSNGHDDYFISKFDSDGNYLWARTWGNPGGGHIRRIATDDAGNLFVTGVFGDAVDFDPGPGEDWHVSNGGADAFLCKFLPDGSW
ncbi:MAG: hypothetical protein ABIC40_08240 [bacterium]